MKKLLLSVSACLAFIGLSAQTFILEDFTSFTNDTLPPIVSGWKNLDSSAVQNGQTWRFNDPGGRSIPTPFSGRWATLDSDNYGGGNTQNSYLQSPNFNASTATSVILEFDHVHIDLNDTANVEVFDGTNWNVVARFAGVTHGGVGTPMPAHEIINISQWAAGVANAQIRFHYIGTYAWYWSIDNVNIYQPVPDDAAAVGLDSLNNGCGLDSVEVKFTFRNAGSSTINTVPLEFRVNGGATVREVYNQPILAGDTVTYTFTKYAVVNTNGPGNYLIEANTAFRGDANVANDTTQAIVVNIPILSSFPYTEDFENGNGGWTSGGNNSSWALGTPAASVINSSAGSGLNSWATNLTGIYNANEESYVLGPCFDFTNLAAPQIKMDVWWNSEFSWDGAVLQSSIDGGTTWQNVGAFGDPNNWYTDNSINGLANMATPQEGWCGRNSSSNGSAGWVLAEHDLNGLGGISGVLLRIAFGSDGSVQDEGFAFDNVLIQNAPASDVEVYSLANPTSGCGLGIDSVTVCLVNKGSAVISNFPLSYMINGNTAITETVGMTLNPGDTSCYTFTVTANLSAIGTYNFTVYSALSGDGNLLNDTLTTTIENIPILSTFPYFQDFENGTGGWTSGGNNSSWALGTPAASVINSSAGSGINSWTTNLTGMYNASEESFVQGPCFDFTNIAAPQIKMDVWWNSEFSWDGAVLQSSIDGGTTWQNVGAFGSPNNWYTDNSINGLANIAPAQEGWSGRISSSNGSGGWVLAEHDLNGLGGISGVLLRIAFGSDGSVQDEGFAFDNVLVQNAPANDVGVISLDNPESGCGLGNNPITVCLVNRGSASTSTFPISYSLNGAVAVVDSVRTPILPGDTLCYTFSTPTNLSTPGLYNFVIYSDLNGDGNPLNDTLMTDVTHFGAQTIPYIEDFDLLPTGATGTLPNNWITNSTGAFEWITNSGGTTSGATGPTGDNTSGSGIYVYTEASSPAVPGEVTTLTSTCLDFGSGTRSGITLEYYYHMYGADILALEVYLDSMGTWVMVDNIIGQQQFANADPWLQRQVSLNNYVNLGPTAIRFEVVRGASFNGDVAIDDVAIFEPSPDDVGVVELLRPTSDCGLSSTDTVEVAIVNFGTNAAMNFPLSYSLNGAAAVTETFAGTILPGDTGFYAFTATVNLSSPGTYTFDAFTSMTNDGFPLNDSLTGEEVVNSLIMAPSFTDFDNLATGSFGSLANGWELSPTTGFRWQTNTGQTGSFNTGPSGDNTTGSGIYVYTEASSGAMGDTTFMTSPCVDIMNTIDPTIIFAYHMFGVNMGNLYVQIDNGSGWITIDSLIGEQDTSLTDPWNYDTLNINAYKNGNQIKFRFAGVRGSSYEGDMSIDDVQLISLPVGIENSEITEHDLNIFPNPNNGEFNLTLPKSVEVSQISILDINGKLIDNATISRKAKSVYNIDLSGQAKGVYMLRVNDENTVVTKKVIVQ